MPNWVNNYIVIEGDAERLDALEKHIKEPSPFVEPNTSFTFHSFITLSPDKVDEYHETNGWKEGVRTGDTEFNWYNWNCNNWNTKWDACNPDLDITTGQILIRFETAWAAPIPVFEEMAKQYPDLDIEFEWEEEQGFGQILKSFAGSPDVQVTKEWDSPGSHQDHVDQEKLDSCLCAHYDNPDDWYEDCPKENIQVYEVEVVTKYTVRAYTKDLAAKAVVAEEEGNEVPSGTEIVSANYDPEIRVSDPLADEETE